jgi:hypothetical protein
VLTQRLCDLLVRGAGILLGTAVSVSTAGAQFPDRYDPIVARVLSATPFVVEILVDPHGAFPNAYERPYAPHPIDAHVEHSYDDVSDLRYGDIIKAAGYSYPDAGGGELGVGHGLRDIRRIAPRRANKYDRKGFLLYYRPFRNQPSYLTIYRDGTVRLYYSPGNQLKRRLTAVGVTRLIAAFYRAHINRQPSDARVAECGPGLTLSINQYQQL